MDEHALIKAFVERQVLSQEQGDVLLRESASTGQRVEDMIHDRHLVDEVGVAKAKADIMGIPYLKVRDRKSTRLNSSH